MLRSSRISVCLLVAILSAISVRQSDAGFWNSLVEFATDAGSSSENDALSFQEGVLMTRLSQDRRIPLVGLGVGHSPHRYVGALVAEALQDDKRTRLIDTASSSGNEELVAEGIVAGAERLGEKIEVHVVTKIWYTHLGYERTKLSIQESLKALEPAMQSGNVDLKVHFLLNWPRCYNNISWMNCASEEQNLPSSVKQAGPDPNQDNNAWKESWKYLEEAYLSGDYPIESIGLSNFHLHDLEQMDSFARVQPHILQANLWSTIYDSQLVDYCSKHDIHIQVYNAMQGTIGQPGRTPHAFHHVQKVANELTVATGLPVTPAQVVLAWLVQHGISVIPRTSKLGRLEENSGVVLSTIPEMTNEQVEVVAHAVEAFLSGQDMEKELHAAVTFHAVVEDLMLYWVASDGAETRIDHIRKGETFNETTYPNHLYKLYNAYNKDKYSEHRVAANFGEHQHIYIDMFDYDEVDPKLQSISERTSMAADSK